MSQNSQKAIYTGVSFSVKLKVVGWKETPAQVYSSEFCENFKTDYLVVYVQTTAFDILGYPCVGIYSTRSISKKCIVFFSILVIIYFKLSLESCTISGVYLEPYQTSMMLKRSIIDIWQGSKYGSAVLLFFYIFPLSLFGYLNEYMNILFFFCNYVATFAHVT